MSDLLGRETELAAIETLLDGLATGGRSLVLEGDPGIGKTALLDAAARAARERGFTALRTAGVASEARMPLAGLHRLLRPHLGRLASLPPLQRHALSAALGHAESENLDPFLVGLATLELVSGIGDEGPIVVLVDDVHWLDRDTLDVIEFVARRIELDRIAIILTVRTSGRSALPDVDMLSAHLKPLSSAQSAALIGRAAPKLGEEMRLRVLDEAAGNPLALIELPKAISAVVQRDVDDAMPLTHRLERAFADRLPELPRATQAVLLVAALDEGASLATQLAAAAQVHGTAVGAADVEPAERAGLARVDASVSFSHPLIRAAVVSSASGAERQAAHAALAEAQPDPERRVWHQAASVSAPHATMAAELELAAERARHRGAPAAAAHALMRAADLVPEESDRARLLLRAAELDFDLGRHESGRSSLDRVAGLPLDAAARQWLVYLTELADEDGWSSAERVAAFARLASEIDPREQPDLAIKALLTAAIGCWWGNPTKETRDLVVAAARRLDLTEIEAAKLAVLACADPVAHSAAVVRHLEQISPSSLTDPVELHLLGTAGTVAWAFDLALPFLARAADLFRAQGRLGMLARCLVSQSWAAVHLARETMAVATADEASRLARETGQVRWAVAADLARATIAGERGDFATLELMCQQAERELLPTGAHAMLALVQFARGRAAVAHQQYADGYDQLRRILDPSDVAYHPFVGAWALSDLVEAAHHEAPRAEAERYLDMLAGVATRTSGPFLVATLAYARPLLAREGEAESLFRQALEIGLANWPCYRGRLLLGYGRWLRRERRVADSRIPLRLARENFDALAFGALAESARRELRASGESSPQREPDARDQLTPQELQIAQLAASGLSNRAIGEQLYLSHRTVESHLYRIYPKLGITSRAHLRIAVPSAALALPLEAVTQATA